MKKLHLATHLLKLYEYIYRNPYVPIDQLSYHFNKSKRSIYSYIKSINDCFDDDDNKIILSQNPTGYFIKKYPSELLENQIVDNQEDRVRLFIRELLVNNIYQKIDDFADMFYVSSQTIKNDLRIVKKRLLNYQITITQKPYYGILIEGNEINIRKALVNIVLNHRTVEITKEELNFFKNKNVDLYALYYYVLSVLNGNYISIPDYQLKSLIFHIAIAIVRIQQGYFLTDEPEILMKDIPVFNQIIGRCESIFHINIPDIEKRNLYVHFVSKISYVSINDLGKDIQIEQIAYDFIKKLDDKFHFNLKNDKIFVHDIIYHLEAFIKRIELGMDNPNPLIEEIKKKYSFEYDITMNAMQDIIYKYHVSEDEIGFFTLHVRSSLERNRYLTSQKIIHIILVCDSGLGTKRLIETKLLNAFGDLIEIIRILSYYEYLEIDNIQCDLIISTIDIPNKNIPIILINPLFNKKDELCLQNQLYNFTNSNIFFSQLFNPSLFKIKNKKIDSKENILKEICTDLEKKDYVDSHYFQQILYRESISSTAIGHLIAIPHAIDSNIKKSFIYICILKNPVLWETQKKVQLIFVLGIKDTELVQMRQFNHVLSNYLDNIEAINILVQSKDYFEFEKNYMYFLNK